MANKPSPRLLPTVKYDPWFKDQPPQAGSTKEDGDNWRKRPLWDVLNELGNSTGASYANGITANPTLPAQPPATNAEPQWGAPPTSYAQARAYGVAGGAPQYIQDAFKQYYQQNPNGANVAPVGPQIPGNPPQDTGKVEYLPYGTNDAALGAGANNPNEPAPMANQYNRLQDAVNKNQSLTEKATAAGDEKEMKRLDDEWARLTSTPQFKAMYGTSDPMAMKSRLINSYMQPGNPAAESSMERAAGRMVSDDIWAEAYRAATGGAPSDLEWKEHWEAMNRGGRDPLEGHPMAIQAIQRKRDELNAANQQAAYDSLNQWFTNSKPL